MRRKVLNFPKYKILRFSILDFKNFAASNVSRHSGVFASTESKYPSFCFKQINWTRGITLKFDVLSVFVIQPIAKPGFFESGSKNRKGKPDIDIVIGNIGIIWNEVSETLLFRRIGNVIKLYGHIEFQWIL